MANDPIQISGSTIDLTKRLVSSNTVVGSPAAAAETTVASVTIPAGVSFSTVVLGGYAAYTVGTSGTGVNLKIHQTNAAGTTVVASGLITSTAANLDARGVTAVDTSPGSTTTYILTMTVANGSAVSTVSAVQLWALFL